MKTSELVVFTTYPSFLRVARALIEMYPESREYMEGEYFWKRWTETPESYKKFVGATKSRQIDAITELDKLGIELDKTIIDNKFDMIWKHPFASEWDAEPINWVVHSSYLWWDFHWIVCSILGDYSFANFMKGAFGIELTDEENERAKRWYKYFTGSIRGIVHSGFNDNEGKDIFEDIQKNQDKYLFPEKYDEVV